jgi:hypothetical protein
VRAERFRDIVEANGGHGMAHNQTICWHIDGKPGKNHWTHAVTILGF